MAFSYRVELELPAATDFADVLVAHFTGLGFELTNESDVEWTFRRGHKLAFLYRIDIRAYATVLRVRTAVRADGEFGVRCDFEIFTFLAIPTSEDVSRLENEVAQLVSRCIPKAKEPRQYMSASRQPGQYFSLWVLFLLIVIPAGLVGLIIGCFAGLVSR